MNARKVLAGLLALVLMGTCAFGLAEGTETVSVQEIPETADIEVEEAVVEVAEDEGKPETQPAETKEEAPAAAETESVGNGETETETAEVPEAQNVSLPQMPLPDNQRLDASYTLALDAINSEDYATAKEYLEICFVYCDPATNPEVYSDLLLKRACINVIEGKNDLALLNLDAALRVSPNLADAYLVRTQIYATQGDAERAVANLEQYIDLTKDTSMYETVAQLQEAMGNIEAAQEAYAKYAEGAGVDQNEAGFQSGLYMIEAGKFEEAIAAFEAYADDEVYGAGAMYNIGICKMNTGDYTGAVQAFSTSEEKGGNFEGLYFNKGVCSLLSGDYENGVTNFTKSIETEPFVADAQYDLGLCQMQLENYDAAVEAFTALIENSKDSEINYGVYYYRAACREALGEQEGAIEDYTVCIDNGFELAQSYYQRAQVYGAMGRNEERNADLANSLKYAE